MKQVLLDTNFILSCISQKIDFIHELKTMGYEIIVPQEVIREIDGLSTSSGRGLKVKHSSNLASSLIKLNKEHIKIISLGEKGKNNVDILIIKYAKAHPDTTIATLDRELKSKIKGNMKIVIHDKRALEISSR